MPLYGSMSDIFGRQLLINIAIALFTLGSILCATAKNMQWLVAARVVQGLGAGGTLNLVSVIVGDMTSLRERGKYMALTGLAWAVGTIAGVRIIISPKIASYHCLKLTIPFNRSQSVVQSASEHHGDGYFG